MSFSPARLKQLRDRLLRLHKTLLDADRAAYERAYGRVNTSGEWLQLVLGHEHFGWLRPFSGLIVRIDEWVAAKDAPTSEAEALWNEAERLTAINPAAMDEGTLRYREAIDRSADAAVAHAEVRSMLDIA